MSAFESIHDTPAFELPPRRERPMERLPTPEPAFDTSAIPPEWWKFTEHNLPCGNDERMPNQFHGLQINLLTAPLEIYYKDRPDAYVVGDMWVYYSPYQILTEDFKGPDVSIALGVEKRVRESWVTWQEGKPPDVVIEILSKSNAMGDKKPKKQVYQDKLKVPEYFWFNPRNAQAAGFELVEGIYQPIQQDRKRRLRSKRLDLLLVRWKGVYRDAEGRWLRWATLDGILLPTADEIAERQKRSTQDERRRADEESRRADEESRRADEESRRATEAAQQAEMERQRANAENERADRLAARLRELGIDPEV